MSPDEWIALAAAALRGSVGQLRDDPAKLHVVADYLESVADQAPRITSREQARPSSRHLPTS